MMNVVRARAAGLLAASAMLLAHANASAGPIPVLDASNPITSIGAYTELKFHSYQQSFVIGQTGLLAGMAWFGQRALVAPIKLRIGGSDDTWVTDGWDLEFLPKITGEMVDLTQYGLQVHQGDTVVFEIGRSALAGIFLQRHGYGNLFKFRNNTVDDFWQVADRSLAFSSWVIPRQQGPDPKPDPKPEPEPVDPSRPVPEPNAGLLLALGLLLLMVGRRAFRPAA